MTYTFRVLTRDAGHSLLVIAILAFGIGASASIFSFVHGVLLKPLPFSESERLVWIWQRNPDEGVYREYAAPGDYADWRETSESFEDLASFHTASLTVSDGEVTEQVEAALVSSSFFELLRVEPIVGRRFTAEEDGPGRDGVVMLSHRLWRQSYGSDQEIAGRTITVDGRPRTVIGVLAPSFHFDPVRRADLFLPAAFELEERDDRTSLYLSVFGRLADGVGLEAAGRELAVVGARLGEIYPAKEGWQAYPELLRKAIVAETAVPILVFSGASLCVLFIICWNVANLELARLQDRKHELATRLALGAPRRGLIGQLIVESVVLAVAGGLGGLLISQWGTGLLKQWAPSNLPRVSAVSTTDLPVLGFALVLALGSALTFGLLPALKASRTDPWQVLQQGGMRSGGGMRSRRSQNVLVMMQLTLVIPLLVAAVLLFRSFVALQSLDPGFRSDGLYTTSIVLPAAGYPEPVERAAFYRRLVEELSRRPGITSVSAATTLPFSGAVQDFEFTVEGRPRGEGERIPVGLFDAVTADYFRTMGLSVTAGRPFSGRDDEAAPPVVVVNQALARRYWPDGDPVGERIVIGRTTREVVGVVADVRDPTLGPAVRPKLYIPQAQMPMRRMGLLVRSRSDLAAVAGWIRGGVQVLDPRLPPPATVPLEDLLADALAPSRLYARLMAFFSFTAVVVAALGLYGLLAHAVQRRRNEIGIRMVHGARRRDVLRLVVGDGMAVALAALLIGCVLAVVAARALASILYGIPGADPATLLAVVLLLAVTALAAAVLPARRATRVDPIRVLRYE